MKPARKPIGGERPARAVGPAEGRSASLTAITTDAAEIARGAGRRRKGDGGEAYGIAELYETDDNPLPTGAHVTVLETADGVRLRCASFPASGRALGTVLLVQGRNECIEKYFETARDLAAEGFATVTFDWRGQGGSDRLIGDPMRGYVRDFNEYETDLHTVLESETLADSPGPVSIAAHSMGALVSLLAAPRVEGRVARIVALAPLIRIASQPFSHTTMRVFLAVLRALRLGRLYAAGGPRAPEPPAFETNVLTSDPARHARNARLFVEHPHLALGGPTVAWAHAALRAMARVRRERLLVRIGLPSLLVGAGDDTVVSTRSVERLARRMRNANCVVIDGARHELLQERDRYRRQAIAAITAFAARRADAPAAHANPARSVAEGPAETAAADAAVEATTSDPAGAAA